MPNYMLLLHADEKAGQALPREVMAQWMEKMHAYKQALDKAGAHIAHGALGTSTSASIVNLDKDGEMQVHNGPFAETKEQLGGYYLIRAESRGGPAMGGQMPGGDLGPHRGAPGHRRQRLKIPREM